VIDLLYVAHNRREFTIATFTSLVAHTNWERVRRLHVLDDDSTDGTWEFLTAAVSDFYAQTGRDVDCVREPFGGPVAAMNHALDNLATDTLCKVDNDFLVCPGWLDALLSVLDADDRLDVLGLEAGFGDGLAPVVAPRGFKDAGHLIGIGAFRARIFESRRPVQHNRYFGLTRFMVENAECGWLTPDLPCFALDHLPVQPWRSLTTAYVARGWSRPWPPYPDSMRSYWDWWPGALAVAE
jgi:glycosyltransferase involved in cell wall biosynthesis